MGTEVMKSKKFQLKISKIMNNTIHKIYNNYNDNCPVRFMTICIILNETERFRQPLFLTVCAHLLNFFMFTVLFNGFYHNFEFYSAILVGIFKSNTYSLTLLVSLRQKTRSFSDYFPMSQRTFSISLMVSIYFRRNSVDVIHFKMLLLT